MFLKGSILKGAGVAFGAGSDVGFSALDPFDPLRPAGGPVSFDIPTRNNESEKEMNEDAKKVPVRRQEPYVISTPRRDVNKGNGEQPEFFWQKDDEEMDLYWKLLEEVVSTDKKRDLVMSQWAALGEFSIRQMMHPDYEQEKRKEQVRSLGEQLRRFEVLRPRVEEDAVHTHQASCLMQGCVDFARSNSCCVDLARSNLRAMTKDGQDGTKSDSGNGSGSSSGSGSGTGVGGGSECSSTAVLWSDEGYNRCPVEHKEGEGTSQCPFTSNNENVWLEHVAGCTWSKLQTCVHCKKFEGWENSVREHFFLKVTQ